MTRPDLPNFPPSPQHRGSPPAARALAPTRLLRIVLAVALSVFPLLGCAKSVEDQLAEIRLQQEIGLWEESITALRELMKTHPEQPEANFRLGTAQVRLGQAALAIWPLEIAARSAEWANQANLALGVAYLQLEQVDPALAAADRVLAAEPEDLEQRLGALRLRAAAHLQIKDWNAALEDTDQILALHPDDADTLLLRANALMLAERREEAESALRRIWELPALAETPVAARAGLGLVKLYEEQFDDAERAETALEVVLERFPTQPEVLRFTLGFFERAKRPERASELLQNAIAREPNDLHLRSILADQLVQQGKPEEAEKLLLEITELLESPQARITLAEFYRTQEKYEEALVELERTLEMLPGVTDYLRFKHADLLAVAGHLERAEEEASQISEPAYRDVVAGRVAFDRGDDQRALELLDAGLRRWPNNPGARYLAGKASLRLGQLERAVAEFREAARVAPGSTDADLELAWIYLSQGDPKTAAGLIGRLLKLAGRDNQRAGKALLLLARAQSALGLDEQARNTLTELAKAEPERLAASLQLAAIEARTGSPEAAIRSLETSQLDLGDPANQPALAALCEYLVAAGRSAEALERLDAAIRAHAELAAYHDLRARVLFRAGRSEDARRGFERALELDPENASALEGLALLAEAQGDLAQARELLDRAAEADSTVASYPYQAAQLELAGGRPQAAETRLREALRRDPLHAQAANDLAWLLAERGEDLDLALRLALRARKSDESAAILDTLGWVQFKRASYPAAVASLQAAHELDPASPSIAYRLGLALAESGETERARALLREALDSGEFPESEQARAQLARLSETQP